MTPDFRRLAIEALERQAGALELPRFWALVAECRWEDETAPHEDPWFAAGLRDCARASSRFWELRIQLQGAIEKWEGGQHKVPAGDDSFGDLVSHVIGLGEHAFARMLADPSLAVERAENRDYRESFAYVIMHALTRFDDDAVRSALLAAARPRPWIDGESWPRDTFIQHEQWGLGFVTATADAGVRVTFEGSERTLPGAIEQPADPAWVAALDGRDLATAIRYSPAAKLAKGDLVTHPAFGLGVVTAIADGKATMRFATGEKKLVTKPS